MKKPSNPMSFDEWFREQCGPEPSQGTSLFDLECEARALRAKADMARHAVETRQNWLVAENAALYAWQLADMAKRKKDRMK